ncbi:MAG: replicative DNA helicase [Chloroflexi bacterium]|nr:MAG: replicative DNA helicase [Chloroflexota bacterium]
MLDRNAIVRIADFLRPDDFYLDQHGQVYRAAINLYDRSDPIDLLTMASELERMRVLDRIGGQEFLAELESGVPTAANVEYYGHLVEEAATKRKLIAAGSRITGFGFDESVPAVQALDQAEGVIFSIAEGRITQDFVPLKDVLKETWDQIERIHKDQSLLSGVPSGFTDLDAKTGGFQKSDLIIIAARPGIGKCLTADSLIDDPQTGERLTIEAWVRQRRPVVLGTSKDGQIRPARIADWVDSGRKPCFAVTTQSGRTVKVTGHHPFLTVSGWQPLHDLVMGEAIAVPRHLPSFGKDFVSPQSARLLGYFIGDGSLTASSPGFTNVDEAILDDFRGAIASEFPACHIRTHEITHYVSAIRGQGNPVIRWLRQFGVWGKKAEAKRFPSVIWRWNRATLREFLRALMSCDGSIFALNGRPRIEFAVASEGLAKDLHHALVRFGIVARFYRKSERCWRVQLTSSESVARYQSEIGWIGAKAERFPGVVKQFRGNAGHLPVKVWEFVEDVSQARGLSWTRLAVLSGERAFTSKYLTYNPRTNHGLSQRRLATFAAVLDDPYLDALASPELYWDRIASIEPVGEQQVYDLAVPDGENFIAEDIVVHNTSLTLNIAQHASIQHKIPVAIFSLEMSEQQLVTRLLCSEAAVDSYRLRSGLLKDSEWPRIAQAMGALSEAQIFIDDSPSISAIELRTKARRLKSANNLGLIIVDYLQLMHGQNQENRVQEISDISRSLKSLARELQIPVIACSQLSREPEKRTDHRPQLADLRESGALEQDADLVLFIYRERMYNDNLADDKRNIAEILIGKHRNGPVGKVELLFVDEQTKFVNLDRRR